MICCGHWLVEEERTCLSQRGAAPISERSVIADPVRRAGTLYKFFVGALEPWSCRGQGQGQ